jgi:hypothetical protein
LTGAGLFGFPTASGGSNCTDTHTKDYWFHEEFDAKNGSATYTFTNGQYNTNPMQGTREYNADKWYEATICDKAPQRYEEYSSHAGPQPWNWEPPPPPSNQGGDSGGPGGQSGGQVQGGNSALDKFQKVLDWAGWIPGVGDVADGLNCAIYAGRGMWSDAALSCISVIPVVGDALGKGARR